VTSWQLYARNFKINGHSLTGTEIRYVNFDMALPYIYLPNDDFMQFQIKMANYHREVHCNYNNNYCKFLQSCATLNPSTWFSEFELFDDFISNRYSIPSDSLFLIDGTTFGDSINTCYLPVFRSITGEQD